jgi:hypothetical protein
MTGIDVQAQWNTFLNMSLSSACFMVLFSGKKQFNMLTAIQI